MCMYVVWGVEYNITDGLAELQASYKRSIHGTHCNKPKYMRSRVARPSRKTKRRNDHSIHVSIYGISLPQV